MGWGRLPRASLKVGDDLLGDGLDVSDAVLSGAGDAEDDVPCPGVDVLLDAGDTLLHRAQHAIVTRDVVEVASVLVTASQVLGGNVDRLLQSGVNSDMRVTGPLETGQPLRRLCLGPIRKQRDIHLRPD